MVELPLLQLFGTSLRTHGSAACRGILSRLVGFCALMCPAVAWSQLPAVPFPVPEITVSYVSELPWPSDTNSNPLEWWAKRLAADWAPLPTEGNTRLSNLRPELSWDQLRKSSLNGRAQVFVIQAYEFVEQGASAKIQQLLTPAQNGKAAMTEFVILRRREDGKEGVRFNMSELYDHRISVHRGGCGDLVYRWLETEIQPETGNARRETFAEFHSARSAAEAVLSVYFGDSYACVVSREGSTAVFRTNPSGLGAKLEEVRCSPSLLRYIIGCRTEVLPEVRQDLVKSAAAIRLQYQGSWTLAVPSDDDFRTLKDLVSRKQDLSHGKDSPPLQSAARVGGTPSQNTASRDVTLLERRKP